MLDPSPQYKRASPRDLSLSWHRRLPQPPPHQKKDSSQKAEGGLRPSCCPAPFGCRSVFESGPSDSMTRDNGSLRPPLPYHVSIPAMGYRVSLSTYALPLRRHPERSIPPLPHTGHERPWRTCAWPTVSPFWWRVRCLRPRQRRKHRNRPAKRHGVLRRLP